MRPSHVIWLAAKLSVAFLLPAIAYVWISQSVLKNHLKSSVINDPEINLARSLSTLQLTLDRQQDSLVSKASHIAENQRLVNALTPPLAAFPKLKALIHDLASSTNVPLFVLTDKKGNVLYDTLNLPRPTPAPPPTSTPATKNGKKKGKKTKKASPPPSEPALYSVKDWPGVAQALKGSPKNGGFSHQDSLYQTAAVPLFSKKEVVGILMVGAKLDVDFLQEIKKTSQNDIALYLGSKMRWTTFPDSAKPTLEKLTSSFNGPGSGPAPKPNVKIGPDNYLWGSLPLDSFDQKSMAQFMVFQTSKQTTTVEGTPGKTIFKYGIGLILFILLTGAWLLQDSLLPLRRLTEGVDRMKQGDLNVSLPVNRPDEWGALARSLKEMAENLREKERVSLVLGKVVSPQLAKNILTANDLFALKGERRECALLYADLRGFNILSENMPPEKLVEALNQFFSVIHEVVFKHEGMLDKFIGDAAIAVWGAPFTQEDKELRAVQAALEIQESLREFNISRIQKNHPPFTVGIGIHAGLVVSGNLGSEKRNDYTIIGPALDIARRLCAKASPGQVVISEEVYEKTKPRLKVASLGSLAVPGRLEALPIYEVSQFV